jgi:uncharacterized membrane protein YphA (DoxX/SURF4 family)
MTEAKLSRIARTGLRLSLATAFLSAVAGRFGFWRLALHPNEGWQPGAAWSKFLVFAGQLNWFLPKALVPFVAVAATTCEITFGVCLLLAVKTRWAAYGASVLLMIFALAMMGDEFRSPFDYSVFTASFGALTLALLTRVAEQER